MDSEEVYISKDNEYSIIFEMLVHSKILKSKSKPFIINGENYIKINTTHEKYKSSINMNKKETITMLLDLMI